MNRKNKSRRICLMMLLAGSFLTGSFPVFSQNPYDIAMTIYGDPTSKMAFNWYTDKDVSVNGKVQIVEGKTTDPADFSTPLKTIDATYVHRDNLRYYDSKNGSDFVSGSTKSYTEYKALATGLTLGTTYSFRVGKAGAWSEIGSFTTAKGDKDAFSFIYTTDSQAQNKTHFNATESAVRAADNRYPNVDFWLMCGDMVETWGYYSEWEWEQFFAIQQDIFLNKPLAVVVGNHDAGTTQQYHPFGFVSHFNTENNGLDKFRSNYSFVYGDALFFALSFEEYYGNLTNLKKWMQQEINKYPDVKWRIVFSHRGVYTGGTNDDNSYSHQDEDKSLRDQWASVYDELKINLLLQGHDHIYQVIGPIFNKQVVEDAITDQTDVPVHARENATGKWGGVYNTENGTLHFLNNSSGIKKYIPRSRAQMDAAISKHGVTNYFDLFTGRFGQTGNPTYSHVTVSSDKIVISTYEIDGSKNETLFDEFTVVSGSLYTGIDNAASEKIEVYGSNRLIQVISGSSDPMREVRVYNMQGMLLHKEPMPFAGPLSIDRNWPTGAYVVKVISENKIDNAKLIIK